MQSKKILYFLITILLITITAYSPTFQNDFTNWDDHVQVTENLDITELSFKHTKTIFTSFYVGMYQPITTMCFAVGHSLFGLNPVGFHTISLLFHLLNTLLVFLLIFLITSKKDITIIVAALFAIHPMFVESVAWVSASSTLVYSFFYLGTLVSYLYYLQKKNLRSNKKYLLISILLFIFSCLSKAQAITLPVLLLLFDYYYDRKLLSKKVMLEKLPFFVLAITFGIIAMQGRDEAKHFLTIGNFTFIDKIFVIPYQILWYIVKLFAPLKLSAFYPYPEKTNNFLPIIYYISPVILLAISLLIYKLKNIRKELIFGTLFFLITASITLKIFELGEQITTDRYTYIPYIGLFLIIGYAYNNFTKNKPKHKHILQIVLTCFVIFLSVLTFYRTKVWKNSFTLWDDVIKKYDNVDLAYNSRGVEKKHIEDFIGALDDLNKAIEINSNYIQAYFNRANTKFYLNRFKEAIEDYNNVLQLNVKFEFEEINNNKLKNVYHNRANAKICIYDFVGAIKDFDKAIGYKEAHVGREYAIKLKKTDNEIAQLKTAEELNDKGAELMKKGNFEKNLAVKCFTKAIELEPQNPIFYNNSALAYYHLKQYKKSLNDILKAQSLGLKVDTSIIKTLKKLVLVSNE